MRNLILIPLLLHALLTYAQDEEFTVYDNGLIYSKETVNQLKLIVDSLNLKFRACDLSKDYRYKLQGKANSIFIDEKKKSKEALKDLEAGIGWSEFINKYNPEIDTSIMLVKFEYIDYNDDSIVNYQSIPLGDNFDYEISFKRSERTNHEKENWAFQKYWNNNLRAFYLSEPLQSKSLPFDYARLVQYSNCMIDTTSQVIYNDANDDFVWEESVGENINRFMSFADSINKKDQYLPVDDTTYWNRYKAWNSIRFAEIEKTFPNPVFDSLLEMAVNEAMESQRSYDEFEEYVARYYSKEIALEFKRRRKVVGTCSMDLSPREHAKEIALLSAEIAKWDVFLKSHLDIMNDNFDRVSDGSYAWEGRRTYIQELEVLDINILDLLIGITLRIENPSDYHYFGDVSRVGRSLSESSERGNFEEIALKMVADEKLDDFNRLLIYYILVNYKFNIIDDEELKRVSSKVEKAKNSLPNYIKYRL